MKKQNLKALWGFTKNSRTLYALAVVSVFAEVFFSFVSPLIVSFTVDSVIGDKPFALPVWAAQAVTSAGGRELLRQNLWLCGAAFVAVMLLRSIFLYTRGLFASTASERATRGIRDRLYNRIQNAPFDYHVKAQTGDLIQRCTSDVEKFSTFFGGQFVECARVVFMLGVALFFMSSIHLPMTALALCLVPVLVLYTVKFSKNVQGRFTHIEEAEGKLSTILQENLTGVRVVRAFGREADELRKFDGANRDFRDKDYGVAIFFARFYGLSDMLIGVQTLIVLLCGAYLAMTGVLTVGQFIVFYSYMGMLMWPIRNFGRIIGDLTRVLVGVGRIDEVLRMENETDRPDERTPDLSGDIVFSRVGFSYGGEAVLKDLSFAVRAGETVAILGATGSGKSSLVHLLQRLYDYEQGSVTIGGVELREIRKSHLRRRVGLILQEPFLYSKTVSENIGITQRTASHAEIVHAAHSVAMDDTIGSFEKGYETMIGERGITLSGGQKQRVAIARTLLRGCDILVFDDSLSAVDTETDAYIRSQLRKRRSQTTTFIISHRLSTLMEADRILVLENGRITDEGTHEQLIARKGLYRRIWDIQSELESEEDTLSREEGDHE